VAWTIEFFEDDHGGQPALEALGVPLGVTLDYTHVVEPSKA